MASKKLKKTCVFLPCYLTKKVNLYHLLPEAVHTTCTVFSSAAAVRKYFEDRYYLYEPVRYTAQSCVYNDYVIDFVPLLKSSITGLIYGYIILSFND